MKTLTTTLLLSAFFSIAIVSGSASAQTRETSVTFSPFHLVMPMIEVTVERRMLGDNAMAVVAGIGSSGGATAFELGAQYRYYAIGSFDHGMILGAELLYINASDSEGSISASANGIAIGPMVGYKVAFPFGLTVDLQGGVQAVVATASAEDDSSGQSASGSAGGLIPLLNINFGWTF